MNYQPITDPNELADLIEGAHQVMLRLGGQDGFHKLPEQERALVLAALRAYRPSTSTRLPTREKS